MIDSSQNREPLKTTTAPTQRAKLTLAVVCALTRSGALEPGARAICGIESLASVWGEWHSGTHSQQHSSVLEKRISVLDQLGRLVPPPV